MTHEGIPVASCFERSDFLFPLTGERERRISGHNYDEQQDCARRGTSKIIVDAFLQQFVNENDRVLDIGTGESFFIAQIRAAERLSMSISSEAALPPTSPRHSGVRRLPPEELFRSYRSKIDIIFMSNVLEHLPDQLSVLSLLADCRRLLRPGGMTLILQPNIRYCGDKYWDSIHHNVALTEESLSQALERNNFIIDLLIPRFLPGGFISPRTRGFRLPPRWVSWYLHLPGLWPLFGEQTFVLARKPEEIA